MNLNTVTALEALVKEHFKDFNEADKKAVQEIAEKFAGFVRNATNKLPAYAALTFAYLSLIQAVRLELESMQNKEEPLIKRALKLIH